MPKVIFSISSNDTDREAKVHDAVEELRSLFPELKTSDAFTSADYTGQGPEYLAVAASAETEFPLDRLKIFVKAFEWNVGRDPEAAPSPIVPIDIDIVSYGDQILKPHDLDQSAFREAIASL